MGITMKASSRYSIGQSFIETASAFPDRIVFHAADSDRGKIAYGEFLGDVMGIASRLHRHGLQKGDRAAVILENRPEWCAAYLGIIIAGGTAVPVDAQLGAAELETLLRDASPVIVFHSDRTAPTVTSALLSASTAAGVHPLLINLDSALGPWSPVEYPVPPTLAGDDDIASIIYTSGTTGAPKGVMLTHANFCADMQALIDVGLVSREDNVLSVLPLHHTYAFMCTFLVPVFLGASITYPASLKGPDILRAVQENGVTILIGVPQLLGLIRNGILNRIKGLPSLIRIPLLKALAISGFLREHFDVNIGRRIFRSAHEALGKGFRFFASGGARLDPAVMKELEALGFTVLEGYGLTETSPVVTFNPIERRKPGSAGRPLPGVSLRIVSPDENGEGEVAVRGPMVMKGYYRNTEATAAVMIDGWFRTGDVGRLDANGYLYLTGRTKEVIILSSGKNVYPEDVEKLYGASPLISEICVIGVRGHEGGEVLHGVIVPDLEYAKQARITDIQEALKWEINSLSGRMPPYMRLAGFSVRTEPLPRTPLGKIRRFMVTSATAGRALQAEEKSYEEEPVVVEETARQVLGEVARFAPEGKRVLLDDHLELDIGLDSLSKIELTVALEKILSLSLPEDFLADVHTVGELVERIKARGPSSTALPTAAPAGWKEILSVTPSEADLRLVSLDTRENRALMTHGAFCFTRLLFKVFFGIEARGAEQLPAKGNFIITPNHTSYLDGFAVILALPFERFKTLYSLGLSDFFTGFLKSRFAKIAHVIPIDAASYLNKALQVSAHVLRQQRSLCVFPEGGRSFDGSLMEFKKGVGILAKEMDVPVVPTYISGAREALPRGAVLPRFRKITVTFGPPLRAADLDFSIKPQGMDDYQYFAVVLRDRVKALQ